MALSIEIIGQIESGIPVTNHSTIELPIVLGFTPQNLRKNPGGAVD